MQTVGITGGTGFLGQHLTKVLVDKGYNVVIFTRSAARKTHDHITYAHWDVKRKTCDINPMRDLDAVINLAGAGIADKRLTKKRKKEIVDSRVDSTNLLLDRIREYAPGCKTFISASATGYYGADTGGPPFTEEAAPAHDFLGNTCRLWEGASGRAGEFMRVVIFRIGIVLGKEGGAYPKFALPFSFGAMPILGSGRQVVSWIALNDLVRLFLYAIENAKLSGVYNAVAPAPVTHKELMHTIHKVKRGIAIPALVPSFALRILLGELANEVLKSCTVSAQKTLATGFSFEHPDIVSAIKALNRS